MEAELNGRLIKLDEDGELYWWFAISGGRPLKTPRWRKSKQTIVTDKRGKQYKRLQVGSRKFLVHRLIYYIHNQEWNIWDGSKANLIDHVDRNTFNNNIENLRVVTHQQNCFNKGTSNVTLTKRNTYRAKVRCGEVTLDKVFKTEQEAIDAVNEFKLKYHKF
jgi:hypothetical protein